MRKGAGNKVLKEKLSLYWTGPFKIPAVGPAQAADTPDGRHLGDKLLYLDLPLNISGPAAKPRVTAARCKPCAATAAKPGPRAIYFGGFHRPHCAAPAAKPGPRAIRLGGFHRPHCAAPAAKPGPRAIHLRDLRHPSCTATAHHCHAHGNSKRATFSGTSDSDHSRRSDHDRRDHRQVHPRAHTIPNSTYDAPPKFQQMADAISAATIAAVDRHLAHLGLYPRSDSARLAPVAPPPPTDGCCGPHHTLLRSRTVLCCGPCSLTFRGPRPCSSAPPDGRVLWTPPHTPPLPYSTLLRPLLPYSTLPRASSL